LEDAQVLLLHAGPPVEIEKEEPRSENVDREDQRGQGPREEKENLEAPDLR
jgi:hypothetical protein